MGSRDTGPSGSRPGDSGAWQARWGVLAAALASVGGWACSDCRPRGASGIRKRDTLVVQVPVEPPHLNPLVREGFWLRHLALGTVFEALVSRDHSTYGFRPALAESWSFSRDGRTLLFQLRRGVTFHDGKPLTSKDVVFTLSRVMDPQVTAGSLRASLTSLAGWRAEGASKVVLQFRRPAWRVLEVLSHVPVLPRHVYGSGDLNVHPANRRPVGTGPFRFVRWEPGNFIRFERNEAYWGRKPCLRRIVFRFVRSRTKALELARAGEVDLVASLLPEQACGPSAPARRKEVSRRFRLVVSHPVQVHVILVNHRNPILADVRVRRALLMLIDRQAMVRELFCGYAQVVSGPYWFRGPGYDHSVQPWPHDPERARRLLAAAGWRDTDGDGILDRHGRRLSLGYLRIMESALQRRMLPVLLESFRRAGIAVRVESLPWSKVLQRLRAHRFDMVDIKWASDVDQDLFQLYHSSQCDAGANYGCYSDPEVDSLLEKAHTEGDATVRHALEQKLHRLFHERLPALFLFAPAELSLVSRRFSGTEPSAEWFDLSGICPR